MPTRLLFAALCVLSTLPAQHRVDPRNTYNRILAVVPMVGAGTAADPRRPAYAPLPVKGKAPSRTGIIAFTCVHTDDKRQFLCEFVAVNRAAFSPILADRAVTSFDKGKQKREDIEKEFKKYKKDFDLNKLRVVAP